MKLKFTLLLLLFVYATNYAQIEDPKKTLDKNDKLFYLDSTWTETSKKNHTYFRIVKEYKIKKESYAVTNYYKSGSIQMKGTSKSKDKMIKDGTFTFYYENGNKEAVANYVNGATHGIATQWYENGQKKSESEFIYDKTKRTFKRKFDNYWDENGEQKLINGNGFFEDKDDRNEPSKGEVKNRSKEGTWTGYLIKQAYSYTETFKDGKFISGESIDKDGIKYPYTEYKTKPKPKNGINDFYTYILKNLKVLDFKELGDKIYLTFIVDETGKIVEPKVINDLGYGTAKQLNRIITEYKDFMPGEQRGIKVRCAYTFPIDLSLIAFAR